MNSMKMKVKYVQLLVVDPIGKFGGLVVRWKMELQVKKILFTDFTIEVMIEDQYRKHEW